MSIEDKIRKEQWYVLQKLKEESLRTLDGQPLKYWVSYGFFGGGSPSPENEIKALEKLEEMGAIRIINPGGYPDYI